MRARMGLVAALLLAGCGGRGSLYTSALKPLPPVTTTSAVVTVVPQTDRAVVLRLGEATPAALPLSSGARLARAVPHANALLVLAGTARAPALDVVDLDANEVQRLALPGFYDAITFSPDGVFAVLTADVSSTAGPLVARNLNEVGLVHVPSRTVTRVQLDTESLAPRAVVFAHAEPNRQLVAVTLERGVALFDALHPEVAPRRITVRPPGTATESVVLEAVFSADTHWLFLRASALDDVIAIELGDEVGAPPSASLNFVSGGRGLSDLEAAPEGVPDAVLAAYSQSNELYLLDARGIQDRTRRFSPGTPVSVLSTLGGNRVLGWDTRGGRTVVAWDLSDGRTGAATLDGPAANPTLVPVMGKAVFFHASTSAGAPALSTVTLADETNRVRLRLQSIQLTRALQASAVDEVGQRLFFAVGGSTAVVSLELATLRLGELALDTPTGVLAYLPGSDALASFNTGSDRLGDVTLWPAGDLERSSARRYTDFLFTGDLDRAEAP